MRNGRESVERMRRKQKRMKRKERGNESE